MVKEHGFINLFRAVAAFWVLSAHCMIWGGWYGIPLPSAKIAVDLFMMITGYLMAANAVARRQLEPLENVSTWLRFWLRRFFRLAPAYYFSLFLATLTSEYFLSGYKLLHNLNPVFFGGAGGVYDPARIEFTTLNLILHVSFLFGLHPQWAFSTFLPDWSLSLEMQFYFVFPILILFMQRLGFLKMAVIICAFSIPIGIYISQHVRYFEPSLLFFKLQYFVGGILIYAITSTQRTSYSRMLMLVIAVTLVSLESKYGKELVALPVLLLAMVLFGWSERKNSIPKLFSSLMNSKFIGFASNSSYGVYLIHGFFISACGHLFTSHPLLLNLPPPEKVGLMFGFVTVFAYISGYAIHRWIELPGIRFGKRIDARFFMSNGNKNE